MYSLKQLLQKTRKAVVVLGRHDHESIGFRHRLCKRRVLDCFASVVNRHWDGTDVDQAADDACALIQQLDEQVRCVGTRPSLSDRAENDGNIQRAGFVHVALLDACRDE